MYMCHGKGKVSGIQTEGRLVVREVFDDGVELVEEFDASTKELLVRRWKSSRTMGSHWDYEIGESKTDASQLPLRESTATPVFVAFDTPTSWEWRIRNLPFSIETYKLSIEEGEGGASIVLRTTNKKYFKRFNIPALTRNGLKPDASRLELVDHHDNVLTIRYTKPPLLMEQELAERKEKLERVTLSQDGQVNCAQQ